MPQFRLLVLSLVLGRRCLAPALTAVRIVREKCIAITSQGVSIEHPEIQQRSSLDQKVPDEQVLLVIDDIDRRVTRLIVLPVYHFDDDDDSEVIVSLNQFLLRIEDISRLFIRALRLLSDTAIGLSLARLH